MTKVYRLESGLDVMQLVIRDRIPPRATSPPAPRTRLHPLGQNGAAAAGLATRLSQLLLFSQLPWQLMMCWPGWDLQRDIRSLAARAAMARALRAEAAEVEGQSFATILWDLT